MWRRLMRRRRARPAAADAPPPAPGPPRGEAAEPPRVLECPLKVLEVTVDPETGRPLGEFLRALGYLK